MKFYVSEGLVSNTKEGLIEQLTIAVEQEYLKYAIDEIEEFDIEFPDIPCIFVRCDEISEDSYAFDRVPLFFFKSAKEIENLDISYPFEVYKIDGNNLTLCSKLSISYEQICGPYL